MRFITLFCGTEDTHLLKDVGMIPYSLHHGFHVDSAVACYRNGEYPSLEREVKGLKLLFIRRTKLGKIADGLFFLMREGQRIDVLNLYHLNLSSFVWSVYFRLFCPKGRIYLKLDMDHFDLQKLKKPGPVRWVKKKTVQMAHLITVESTWMKEQIEPLIGREAVYLPDGAWHSKEGEKQKKEKIILTAGRLGTEQKATEILLEAFAAADLPPDWRLVLAGSIEPSFEETKDLFFRKYPKLAGRVVFTGMMDKEGLEKLYRRAAVFALPSRWESFGIVLAEALFEGCYLIGSDCIPPLRDLTDRGRLGMAVKTGDVKDLAAALRRCCLNGDCLDESRAEEARVYAREHFDWEKIAGVLYRHLSEL